MKKKVHLKIMTHPTPYLACDLSKAFIPYNKIISYDPHTVYSSKLGHHYSYSLAQVTCGKCKTMNRL